MLGVLPEAVPMSGDETAIV